MLKGFRTLSNAQDWLNWYLSTPLLEGAAEAAHNAWRAAKAKARTDPRNPYQGWGEKRIKVRDLSVNARAVVGIDPAADPAADVYHPLDRPFSELSPDVQSKNILPMVTL